jgi:hypothetical protein
MRTGTGNAQGPGTDIPDNGGNNQSQNHRQAVVEVAFSQGFHGEEVDYANGNSNTANIYPYEIPYSGPYNGNLRFEGMGVNDRCNRIGGIMKSINEFEGQSGCDATYQQQGKRSVESKHILGFSVSQI